MLVLFTLVVLVFVKYFSRGSGVKRIWEVYCAFSFQWKRIVVLPIVLTYLISALQFKSRLCSTEVLVSRRGIGQVLHEVCFCLRNSCNADAE